jgi:hypothetical protein
VTRRPSWASRCSSRAPCSGSSRTPSTGEPTPGTAPGGSSPPPPSARRRSGPWAAPCPTRSWCGAGSVTRRGTGRGPPDPSPCLLSSHHPSRCAWIARPSPPRRTDAGQAGRGMALGRK